MIIEPILKLLSPAELDAWQSRRFKKYYDNLSDKLSTLKFGTLTVVSKIRSSENKRYKVLDLRCSECSQTWVVYLSNLMKGFTSSCRCQSNVKYGGHKDPAVQSLAKRYWAAHTRCSSSTTKKSWRLYGARGIRVKCTIEEYIKFFKTHYTDEEIITLQVDRIDNNGHYDIGNMRLVTPSENMMNRRPRVKI